MTVRFLPGDALQAFLAQDDVVFLHGVTCDRRAAKGIARQVNNWCWQLGGGTQDLAIAHFGTPPGALAEVRTRLFAGVTQIRYGEARLDLIQSCVRLAARVVHDRSLRAGVMPLIGAGLGGRTPEEVARALRVLVLPAPIEVYVPTPNVLARVQEGSP